jgi:hypothetical protein
MDRLLDAIANAERRSVIEACLSVDVPLSAGALREIMGVPSQRRGQFGRQIQRLYEVGVLEMVDQDEYVLVEPDLLDRLLQMAAATEASLDVRRAKRSANAASARAALGVRARTARASDRNASERSTR